MPANNFSSEHFHLHQLADGVFAAIDNGRGTAVGNAGIIDLGDVTLVFDTFLTPLAARELKTAAEQLTSRPVTWVINSHYHNDHIRGNQVFQDTATIISAEKARQQVLTDGAEELAADTDYAPQRAAELQRQYDDAPTPAARAQIAFWLNYFRAIANSIPDVQLCPPTLTFDTQLHVHGSQRTVHVIAYDGGHTRSDAILIVPDARIAFVSDLLFVGCHPFLADGDPHAWLDCLTRLHALDVQTFVPGHGPPGTSADVTHMQQYIQVALDTAGALVRAGASADKVAAQPIPDAFSDWEFPQFFTSNMRFLHAHCSTT